MSRDEGNPEGARCDDTVELLETSSRAIKTLWPCGRTRLGMSDL